jgi:hypothetical protein
VQILFAPDADSYRVLGAKHDVAAGDLRRHVGLLLRWLHPDIDPKRERSMFAARVTQAWNDVKTPERRAAYNRRQASRSPSTQNPRMKKKPLTGKPQREGLSARATHGSGARGTTHQLSRLYAPRHIGFFQRLLIHLLGRPIL